MTHIPGRVAWKGRGSVGVGVRIVTSPSPQANATAARPTPPRASRAAVAPLLLVALLAACSDQPPVPATSADDAPDRILVPLPGEQDPLRTLGDPPLLELGLGGEGDPPLHRVRQVSARPGGGVLVVHEGEAAIHAYDAEGRLAARLGREGDGPGEFRRIAGVVEVAPDTFAAFDPHALRLTRITLEGEVLATTRVQTSDSPLDQLSGHELGAVLPGGRHLLLPRSVAVPAAAGSPGRHPGRHLVELDLLVLDSDGRFTERQEGAYALELYTAEGGTLLPPTGARRTVEAGGGWIAFADWAAGEVRLQPTGGGDERVVQLDWPAPVTPDEAHARWIEDLVSRAPEPEAARAMRPYFEAIDVSPEVPYFTRVLIEDEARLWVEPALAPDADRQGSEWVGIHLEEGGVERLLLPERARLMDIAGARAFVVWTDALGVQTVRVYEMRGG